MKKYLFVYDARARNGAQIIGNATADVEKLTFEAIQGVRDEMKRQNAPVDSIVITNIIELEG